MKFPFINEKYFDTNINDNSRVINISEISKEKYYKLCSFLETEDFVLKEEH